MGHMAMYKVETAFLMDLHEAEGGGDVAPEGLVFLTKCHEAGTVAVFVQDEEGVHMLPVSAGGRVWVRNVSKADVLVVLDDKDTSTFLDSLHKLEVEVLALSGDVKHNAEGPLPF